MHLCISVVHLQGFDSLPLDSMQWTTTYIEPASFSLTSSQRACHIPAGSGEPSRGAVGLAAAEEEDRQAFSARRAQEAQEQKKWRADQKEALDDMLPKAEPGRYAFEACLPADEAMQVDTCCKGLAIV